MRYQSGQYQSQIYLPAWLPGLTWKKTVTRSRPEIDNMNLSPFRAAINAVVRNTTFAMSVLQSLTATQNSGSAKSSFATAILEEVSLDEPLSLAEEREMSGAVGTLYTGTHGCASLLFGDTTICYSWNRYRMGPREYDRVRGLHLTNRLSPYSLRGFLPWCDTPRCTRGRK